MRAFVCSKKGMSKVLGIFMIIIVVFVFGLLFVNFAMFNVESMKTTYNTKVSNLLLASFSANTTHIVAFIRNTANRVAEITQAYVNSMLVVLQGGKAIIKPAATGVAIVVGSFMEGSTYTVKLSTIFNLAVTFTVTI